MPIFDFKCNSCGTEQEILVGSHVVEYSCKFICSCGGKFERVFTPVSLGFDVLGGYDYEYGKKSTLKNDPTHRANYLADDKVSPY